MSGPITVEVVYGHPISQYANDIESFSFTQRDIFSNLNSNKNTFYALGDFNFDFFKINDCNNVRKQVDNMVSVNCKCAIDLPIRVTIVPNSHRFSAVALQLRPPPPK